MSREAKALITLFLLANLVALSAVSSQSFWIDEANSAVKAIAPSLGDFIGKMSLERGSDLQMPGYMILLWVWEKVFGPSEFALRALNIPLFIGSIATVCIGLGITVRQKALFVLFACSSAFLWAYLDEARPYILQFLGATMTMAGLYNITITQKGNLNISHLITVLVGLIILLASSLSTIFYVALLGFILLILLYRINSLQIIYKNKKLLFVFIIACFAGATLGLYYFWTLRLGARASGVGKTNITSIIFCIYEIGGFLGFGPGRGELRDNPLTALRSYVVIIALYGAIIGMLIFTMVMLSVKNVRYISRGTWLILGAVSVATLMIVTLGILTQFRVLGRHIMPAFPFLLLTISLGADQIIESRSKLGMILLAAFFSSAFFSCFEIRYAQRHLKDDYRDAAALAIRTLKSGGTIWWAADRAAAEYYGISIGVPNKAGAIDPKVAVNIIGIPEIEMEAIHPPTVVILSKEDIYDPRGSLLSWIKEHHYVIAQQFPSFKVYVAP